MYQAIIIIHIVLGLAIIGLILMQQGKGADAGATFGGGASGSVFGAQGAASFLSRTTAILATLFFLTSLGLAWLNSHKSSGINDLMSSVTAVEKEAPDLGLPTIGGAKTDMAIPSPADVKPAENKTETMPAMTTDKPAVGATTPSAVEAAKSSTPAPVEQQKPDAPTDDKKESALKTDAPAKATEKKKK